MSLWVDFSDIVNWPLKHLTGIQRVVIHVSIELKKIDPSVNFFSFSPSEKKFFIIDKHTIEHALDCHMNLLQITSEEVNFKKEDSIYLLGGTWVHSDFINSIKLLKDRIGFKIIHFLHDITPIKVPHVHRDKSKLIMEEWIKTVYEVSDHFLTNSQFSKNEIESFFKECGYSPKNFTVVRLGDVLPLTGDTVEPSSITHKPHQNQFILCVGSFEPRKNHILLYQAWRLLLEKYQDRAPQLVIVGGKGWLTEDFKSLMFRDPILKEKMIWMQNILEGDLVWLYQNCKFTVYPSYYEGWGLPVAESLAYGKICIASSTSSIPEIAGNLIDYYNPYDSRDCFEKIEKLYFNSDYLEEREKILSENFKTTSWEQTARECLTPLTSGVL